MPENLTLSAYLEQRGKKAKALKKGEADAFGIPYPLQSGWPWRYGAMEITPAMIEDAQARIQAAKQEARSRTHCRLPSADEVRAEQSAADSHVAMTALFRGFVLRQARRYRSRSSAPLDAKKPARSGLLI
jgi:hypothetical protein